jgi:hypothetical protein
VLFQYNIRHVINHYTFSTNIDPCQNIAIPRAIFMRLTEDDPRHELKHTAVVK